MKRYLFKILFCSFLSMPLLADNLSHWQRLAEKGSANAQFNLGAMYDNGDGVPEDAAEKLTTEELNLAQQRATKLFEEIQQKK